MRHHYNNFRHNQGLPEKRVKLETILLNCENCKKETAHIYSGNFGVLWKKQYVYQCMHCKTLYVSLTKIRNKE